MDARLRASAIAFLLVLCLPLPSQAHHSYSMFDFSKGPATLSGTISEFQWTNPHVFLEIAIPKGRNVVSYSIETTSPASLMRMGWKHNVIRPGDKVKMIIYPLRNGQNGGALLSVTLPDGRTLKTGLDYVVAEHQGKKP